MIANGSVEIAEQEGGAYVFPVLNGKRAQGWTLYVFKDGSADLYKECKPNGALIGKPIKFPAPTEIVT